MNKIFIAMVLGLIILLSGCTQPPAAITKYICPDGTEVADKALCTAAAPVAGTGAAGTGAQTQAPSQQLTADQQLSVCIGMPLTQNYPFETLCISGLAAKLKDSSLCLKVNQDQRVGCYALVAESKNSPEACSEANFLSDSCLNQYAMDKKDGSVCDGIKDVSLKDSCYNNMASQTGEASLCDKIKTSGSKDGCYSSMAMRFRDSAYCNKISNESQKQSCLQNIGGYGGGVPMEQKPVPPKY